MLFLFSNGIVQHYGGMDYPGERLDHKQLFYNISSVPVTKLFINELANDLQCLLLSYRPVKRCGDPDVQQRLIGHRDLCIIKMLQVPEDFPHCLIFIRNIPFLPGSDLTDIDIFFPDQAIGITDLYLLTFLQYSYHFISPAYPYFSTAYRYHHCSKIRI